MTLSSKVIVFDKEGKLNRYFGVRRTVYAGISVTVTGNRKVFVLMANLQNCDAKYRVAVHQADGKMVNNFSVLEYGREPTCIISGGGNHVMVGIYNVNHCYNSNANVIHFFDAQGYLLKVFNYKIFSLVPVRVMAFHVSTEHIVIPSRNYDGALDIDIRTKDGKLMRNLQMETDKICSISGITVTKDRRIAVLCSIKETQSKDEKHLVLVE